MQQFDSHYNKYNNNNNNINNNKQGRVKECSNMFGRTWGPTV